MKVAGKIFAIIAEEADPASISLKSEPNEAAALRRVRDRLDGAL